MPRERELRRQQFNDSAARPLVLERASAGDAAARQPGTSFWNEPAPAARQLGSSFWNEPAPAARRLGASFWYQSARRRAPASRYFRVVTVVVGEFAAPGYLSNQLMR